MDEHDTSRDRVVAAVAESPGLGEDRLRLILDALPVPAAYVDASERYRFNNKAHENWLGRTRSELYGLSVREVFGDTQYEELRPFVERALAGEETVVEKEFEYPDGSLRAVRVTFVPDAGEGGGVRGFVAVVKDLTRQKHAEASLRFRSRLLDTVEQAVIATDLAGKIIYWNQHAEKLYGWSAEEAVGRDIVEITPAESSREQAAEIMSRLVAGETWSGEFDLRRRDGVAFPALVTDTPIHDEAGRLVGIVGVSADITERRRAEAAMREAEKRALSEYETLLQRLSHLAESLGTARDHLHIFRDLRDFAVVSVPCVGIFISLYDGARDVRLAKYAWGDGEEVDVSQLPPMPVASEGPNSRAVRTRQVVITNDYWEQKQKNMGQLGVLVGPDNGLRPQSSLVVPMATMGRIVGTVEVQSYENHAYREEHVTAMKMAANLAAVAIENMRLLQFESSARRAAEEANRLKDEFLATLSHELRTPLTAILGWSSMLRDARLDEPTRSTALEIIERNARTQQQIVDDILDVSRIITGQLRLEAEPTDLRAVVEAATDTVRPAATAKSINLRATFEPDTEPVMGDPRRLQQVVWNLLLNAVKFTHIGGEVCVRVEREGAHARVVVSDTGAGIATDFLPFIFDRFRQGDQSTTRTHGGLGLGLAIVRHLVELHGGTVRAESEGAGRGSTFTVELPLLRNEERATRNEERADDIGVKSAIRDPRSETLGGLRVLVVDDEPDALNLIKVILEKRGASVTAVESADAAWRALEDSSHDLLLCDIGMPGEDGYQLIRRLRARESARGVKTLAIALTAYAGESDRAQALEAGFQLHVAKPIDPAGLVSVIEGLIKGSRK
ncbi:MAG TPA: PAS domain S-box protein [Pyrinomonadaceae bacterium]|nr:PAS domain S-box protein [Pyrinomonadaceae bacterium]